MSQINTTISLSYSFSALMVVDKFNEARKYNYFMVKGFELPQRKIYEGTDIKYKGIPTNQITGNFTWSDYRIDMFMTSNYYEYQFISDWQDECRLYREYLHHKKGLLSDVSIYILHTKMDKIVKAFRLKSAFPLEIASFKYEKSVTPIMLPLTFKYLKMEFIDEEQYKDIDISII